MTTVATPSRVSAERTFQLVTCYVGELLLGIDIDCVQEINRQLESRWVPHAPEYVRGVINLRGDVTTLIDLRQVIGMPPGEVTRATRNVMIKSGGELIGLMVDRLADIVTVSHSEMTPPPANLAGVEGRFFQGVFTTDHEVIVVIKPEELFALT